MTTTDVEEVRDKFERAEFVDTTFRSKAGKYNFDEIVPSYWEFDRDSPVLEVSTVSLDEFNGTIEDLIDEAEEIVQGIEGVSIVEPRDVSEGKVLFVVLFREV